MSEESSPDPMDAPSMDVGFDEPSSYTGFDAPADIPIDVMPDMPVDEPVVVAPPPSRSRAKSPASESSGGPIAVCLSCGASPPSGDECLHEEVAHIPSPTPAVLAGIKKLQAAMQERRNQERALRKLVGAEVASGNGEVETKLRPNILSTPITVAQPPVAVDRAHGARASRRKGSNEAQAFFAFAAPPPPPPEPEVSPEPVVDGITEGPPTPEPVVTSETASGTTTEPAPKPRGRKSRKRAVDDAAVVETVLL